MVCALVKPDCVDRDINSEYKVRDNVFEDRIVFDFGKKKGQDPTVITVNCIDKIGLASDLTRTILEFGLDVSRADFCTDLPWCYMVLWVVPTRGSSQTIQWELLRTRLILALPSPLLPIFLAPAPKIERKKICLLQTWTENRLGLLNDMTQALWDHELDIERFNALTTPEGRIVNVFGFNDSRKVLHSKKNRELVYESVKSILGPYQLCKLIPGTAEDVDKSSDPVLLSDIPIELLSERFPGDDPTSKLSISIQNSFTRPYTLLQIKYQFRRGFLYDCIRVLQDCKLQIAHGRFSRSTEGVVELELLILQADGYKLCDPNEQELLEKKLASSICDPIRVMLVNKGLNNRELLIASAVEGTGNSRPRLLYDATLALKMLEIFIFKADNVIVPYNDRKWEVYRFLFVEPPDFRYKNRIVERVMDVLVGGATS